MVRTPPQVLTLLKHLQALEIALHDPVVRTDTEALAKLLHPQFLELGRSGARYTREDIAGHLSSSEMQPQIWAQDFSLQVLSEEFGLLTYRCAQVASDGSLIRHTNRTSLWQHGESGWLMRFHQGTPTQAFEPVSPPNQSAASLQRSAIEGNGE